MDIYSAIRGRRSVTTLLDDVPSRDVIDRIIQTSVWAPNHHLTEPWRFHVLCGDARSDMGSVVATELENQLDPSDPATAPAIRQARSRLLRAPVVIVVSQIGSPDAVTDLEDYAAACCATQNLMLAAHAEGLATKWRTGDMCDYQASKGDLGLAGSDRIVAYLYVGYPSPNVGPDARQRERPSIHWIGWGNES